VNGRDALAEFQAHKRSTMERLIRDGMSPRLAHAWLESFEGGDADLYRAYAAPVAFWANAYHFARHEWKLGHQPPGPPDTSSDPRDPRL
jgi:hypothetical protein